MFSHKRLRYYDSTKTTHRHLAFIVCTKEDGRNSQSHLQLTVVAHDALGPREEDVLKRYRPEDCDDSMAFAEPCDEIGALFFASVLRSVT